MHVALLMLRLARVCRSFRRRGWKPLGRRESVVADPRPARRDDRPARISSCPRRARWSRRGSPARYPGRALIGCSRCRISRRCWRSSATRSCSSRGRRRARRPSAGRCGYALFVGSALPRAAQSLGTASRTDRSVRSSPVDSALASASAAPPSAARQMLWCALAATGSVLLLAVTNHITQNIASVPLLWIVPLAIYLLTFILCFDGCGLVPARRLLLDGWRPALGVMAWTLADPKLTHELQLQIGVFCAGLFLACMFCHGELVRLKPAPALPHALLPDDLARRRGRRRRWSASSRRSCCRRYFELGGGLVLCALLLLWQVRRDRIPSSRSRRRGALFATVGCRVLGGPRVLRGDDRRHPQFLRRPARPGIGRGDDEAPPLAHPRQRSCTAGSSSRRICDARRRPITRRARASAACSNRCIRGSTR